jgi:AmmeMemoRadiSam system protein A
MSKLSETKPSETRMSETRLSETLSDKPSESLAACEAARDLAPRSPEFSLDQRQTLLRIAHQAILFALERHPLPKAPPSSPVLSELRGVFTTLYLRRDADGDLDPELHGELQRESHRELRGCVGYVMPIVPLYRAVAETARAAAFEDFRFLPVTKEEALRLEVSLSVLSRLFPIHPEAVEVGRHGLLISDGARRGLLLPQVPLEHGWDRETFLDQTCRKAGLPLDAWRKTATLEAFTAEVFADGDVEVPC